MSAACYTMRRLHVIRGFRMYMSGVKLGFVEFRVRVRIHHFNAKPLVRENMNMDSDQGKVFVGGISWETTEENLKDYFQRYGEVLEAVIMKDRNTGRARGFGFVSFADPAAADIALLDKHTINGRIVEAKKAVPRDEQQNMPKSSIGSGGQSPGGQGRTKKIFVGGLASTITEEEFRRYFEQFGTISDAVVMYDHTTQRPRGFGFITFDAEESVDNVLLKNFHELNDKLVEVKRAVPKDQSPMNMRAPASGFPGPAGGRGGYAYGQGYPSMGLYRPDGRYGTIPAGRGSYPYPAGGYPPGYGSAGYGMNGSYPAGYAGSAGYGYGGTPAAAGYGSGGTGSPGYGNTPGRSTWPSAAAYGGTTGPGYASGGYGAGMWGSAEQTAGQAANNYAGYYGTDNGYGSNTGGYGIRGSGGYGGYGGSPGGYGSGGSGAGSGSYGASGAGSGNYNTGYNGDGYGSSGYSDGTWRAGGGDSYNGNGGSAAAANGGYNLGPAATEGATNGTTGYGGGYGAASRQTQRGPDARFRPYPTASDRS